MSQITVDNRPPECFSWVQSDSYCLQPIKYIIFVFFQTLYWCTLNVSIGADNTCKVHKHRIERESRQQSLVQISRKIFFFSILGDVKSLLMGWRHNRHWLYHIIFSCDNYCHVSDTSRNIIFQVNFPKCFNLRNIHTTHISCLWMLK